MIEASTKLHLDRALTTSRVMGTYDLFIEQSRLKKPGRRSAINTILNSCGMDSPSSITYALRRTALFSGSNRSRFPERDYACAILNFDGAGRYRRWVQLPKTGFLHAQS